MTYSERELSIAEHQRVIDRYTVGMWKDLPVAAERVEHHRDKIAALRARHARAREKVYEDRSGELHTARQQVVQRDIDRLRTKIEKLKKKRDWNIAVVRSGRPEAKVWVLQNEMDMRVAEEKLLQRECDLTGVSRDAVTQRRREAQPAWKGHKRATTGDDEPSPA
jgi:hypothetical protein